MKAYISSLRNRIGALFVKLLANMAARAVALACVALATIVVARTEGAAGVGIYALLRVLPGLLGVVDPAASPVRLRSSWRGRRDDRRLPLTIVAMAALGGGAGMVLWLAATPMLSAHLFDGCRCRSWPWRASPSSPNCSWRRPSPALRAAVICAEPTS